MIDRYTRPAMGRLWSDASRFQTMLRVEVLACEAMAALGQIPRSALRTIRAAAKVDPARIRELEATTKHDVVAFVEAVSERLQDAAGYLHLGLTSSDVVDTSLAVLMRDAADLLLKGLRGLAAALRDQARRHKLTVMVGRSHGVHAEPTTFGLKLASFYAETQRNRDRLDQAKTAISIGKLSGAVGTFAHVDPRVEAAVCKRLGLRPDPVSSQIVQRDRHAQYLTTLALIGSSLERLATEIRGLQRTETLEVEEPFEPGQRGSSAMPHKRNPVVCERIAGLSRVLRGNAHAALENIALWHERDISHSSVERVIIPDSVTLVDYMLSLMTDVIRHLRVYPDRMQRNLGATRGLIFSGRILVELTRRGVPRSEAYRLVQDSAMSVWHNANGEFQTTLLQEDAAIRRHLSPDEIKACFDLRYYTKHVNTIFKRVFG